MFKVGDMFFNNHYNPPIKYKIISLYSIGVKFEMVAIGNYPWPKGFTWDCSNEVIKNELRNKKLTFITRLGNQTHFPSWF